MSDCRREKWKQYLNTLIDMFRRECARLSSDERKLIPYNLYFDEPCQVEVIEFLEPQYQILIISHNKEQRDKEFNIHVYRELNEFAYAEYIKRDILLDPKWDREVLLHGNVRVNLKTLLEDFFVAAFRWFKEHAFTRSDKPIIFRNGNALIEDIGAWLIKGDLLKSDPREIVLEVCRESPYKYCIPVTQQKLLKPRGKDRDKGFVRYVSMGDYIYVETHEEYKELERYRVKTYLEAEALAKKPLELKNRIRGFGSYIYPPIWVDNIPKMPFKQRIWNKFSTDILVLHEKAIITDYNGHVLFISKDGLIAIGTNDKDKALEELNTIMASILIENIMDLVLPIREHELGEVTIDLQNESIVRFSISVSPRVESVLSLSKTPSMNYFRPIITSRSLLNAIKLAEILSQNDRIRKLSLLILDAYSHLVNHEYSQAFLLSWVIIEQYLGMLLDETLENMQISNSRRRKLKENIQFVLEILNLLSVITNEEYEELKRLKKIRNNLVHNGITPPPAEAHKCFKKALEIVKSLIKKLTEKYSKSKSG